MVIDKPKLDREQVLEEERCRQYVEQCLVRIREHLDNEESLGEPRRVGDWIVIPILHTKRAARSPAPRRAPTPLQVLAAAWMDAPAPGEEP